MVCTKKNGTIKRYKLKSKKNGVIKTYTLVRKKYNNSGSKWTTPVKSFTDSVRSCYGNNKFIAIKSNSDIYTSNDGETWTSQTNIGMPNSCGGQCLVYGNNKFVIIDTGGYISTSTDGVTWSTPTQNSNLAFKSSNKYITYGDNKFVAILVTYYSEGLYVSTSTDGITWSTPSLILSGQSSISSFAYGNNKFIATQGINIYTSTDGTTWTLSSKTLSGGYLYGITYTNEGFVGVGDNNGSSSSRKVIKRFVTQENSWRFSN